MRRSRRRRVGGPQSDGGSLRPDTPQSQHATARQLGDGVASAQAASPCQNCRLQRLVSGLRKPGISRNAIRRCPHAPRRTIEAGRDSEGADARAFPRIKARRSKNLRPLWLAFVSFWVIRLVVVLSFEVVPLGALPETVPLGVVSPAAPCFDPNRQPQALLERVHGA